MHMFICNFYIILLNVSVQVHGQFFFFFNRTELHSIIELNNNIMSRGYDQATVSRFSKVNLAKE